MCSELNRESALLTEPSIMAAAEAMKAGGVVAYPTEAVFGLGCDPFNEAAVAKLLAIKRRPVEKGLILLAADLEQIANLLLLRHLSEDQQQRLAAAWPGPVSFAINVLHDQIPQWITGEHNSVVVRVSSHPIAAALAKAFTGPIASTSANPVSYTHLTLPTISPVCCHVSRHNSP